MFYYIGHFLFAYMYLEAAEMFARKDKSPAKHKKIKNITQKVSYVVVAVIVINYVISIGNIGIYKRVTGKYNNNIQNWSS